MTLSASQKDAISQAARHAPSADNSIPWQYAWLEDDALLLVNDKSRSGTATDSTYILTNLAMGAAAENALLAASTIGLIGSISYAKDEDEIKAIVTFESANDDHTDTVAAELAQQIEIRHSDRRFPYKGEITEDIITNLKNSLSDPAHSLTVYNNKNSIKKIVPYIRRAEAVRFKSESLHSELFDTVKFDEASPDEGMTLDVLGIEAPARPMFRLLRKWSAMKVLNWIGTSQLIAIRSVTLPIINSPG
jgi:nitroreductase